MQRVTVRFYLTNVVQNCKKKTDIVSDLYRHRGEDAWYFLSPRARIYQKGSRPSRKTEDGVGRWRASTAAKVKMAYETVPDGVRFCVNVLNYFVGTDTKNEQRSKWLMREITIPKYKIKCGENGGNNSTVSFRNERFQFPLVTLHDVGSSR
jgi:hypothetical protein